MKERMEKTMTKQINEDWVFEFAEDLMRKIRKELPKNFDVDDLNVRNNWFRFGLWKSTGDSYVEMATFSYTFDPENSDERDMELLNSKLDWFKETNWWMMK